LRPGELRPGELRPGELRPGELRPGELRPQAQLPPEMQPQPEEWWAEVQVQVPLHWGHDNQSQPKVFVQCLAFASTFSTRTMSFLL
ncbi:hypothetical protein KXV47_000906, partial [Aspergillus fumigatus]